MEVRERRVLGRYWRSGRGGCWKGIGCGREGCWKGIGGQGEKGVGKVLEVGENLLSGWSLSNRSPCVQSYSISQ